MAGAGAELEELGGFHHGCGREGGAGCARADGRGQWARAVGEMVKVAESPFDADAEYGPAMWTCRSTRPWHVSPW